jgi:mono/diheme cytochrome c family protein
MWRPSGLRAGLGCWAVAGLAALWAGCSRPGGPDSFSQSEFPVPDAGSPTITPIAAAPKCIAAQSSQKIPARSSLTSAQDGGAASQPIYFTADLYNLFKSVCGSCHVDSNFGGFLVTPSSFPVVVPSFSYMGNSVYQIMTSDDSTLFMPPPTYGGIPYSQRPADDAQRTLANLMQQWLAQGAPAGSFNLAADPNASTTTGYAVSPAMSSQITNIGTCVPDQGMVGTDTSAMDQLDAFFTQATTLPATLDQTDLITLDSEALAKNGVISYAPTYPLWSDNAQKMRYVRVPRGQSIMLDKATQQFQIPPNTRFYKTFLKAVIDVNGNQAYRKIETRLIVSRPDTNNPDGSVVQNALYGTYLWNDDESQASLLTDPLRDGQPFADRLFSYTTDEKQAQAIIAQNPSNLAGALQSAGLTRHYAVPGAERCVQCHMGSPSESFILGFTPLQVSRRPNGSGGLYEAASGDELTQLQRLIDYGVVSGVKSAADILPLEEAEGSRTPRNDYELAAQAYMVGNCAHCHNDRGFPTQKEPALKGLLTFLPGTGPRQGIFQMPLTLNSPIRKRGSSQDVPIPYITPSVYDLASVEATPKYFCRDASGKQCNTAVASTQWFVLAPWRSLIYRNTDTPYDYFDDFTPFPHMPLNSPGYDCRVSKIMGDWMVSIPSEPKDPTKKDDLILVNAVDAEGNLPADADTDPQPYQEILPGDPTYAQAVSDANARLQSYHSGFRYGFCPSTYTQDILDPFIQQQVNSGAPVTSDIGQINDPTNTLVEMPALAPLSPNWVDFDDTEPPGDWFPRRPDWADALVNPDITSFVQQAENTDFLDAQGAEDLTNVIGQLESVSLTSAVKSLVTQQVPFGLWDTTSVAGCDFSSIPTAGSFQGADRPSWMQVAPPPANAPVYVQSYGSAVFNSVCFNCHGPNADAKGLLADEISLLTGGDARVADFRDGLFGPLDQPGANIERVYGPSLTMLGGGLTAEDLASRYMAWMALGGTSKHLPVDVLNQVSQSPVLGTFRAHIALAGTPDMLRIGLELCEEIASSNDGGTSYGVSDLVSSGSYAWGQNTGLIDTNGDAEMWLHLCSLENRPIVRAPLVQGGVWTATSKVQDLTIDDTTLYWGADDKGNDLYGANPVMDQHGNLTSGITADNVFPLCVPKPTSPAELNFANAALAAAPINGNVIPYCPSGIVQASNALEVDSATGDHVDGRRWAARGAINAALAVFLYLEGIERDPSSRPVPYNQCNLIGSTQ